MRPPSTIRRTTRIDRAPIEGVDVYSSLPLEGPDSTVARAIENGINLALYEAHQQAGVLTISYTPLDDATRGSQRLEPAAERLVTP